MGLRFLVVLIGGSALAWDFSFLKKFPGLRAAKSQIKPLLFAILRSPISSSFLIIFPPVTAVQVRENI